MKFYDKNKHYSNNRKYDWDHSVVKETINNIFLETVNGLNGRYYWPIDKNEDSFIPINKSIYYGSTGIIWALDELSRYLNITPEINLHDLCNINHIEYLKEPDTNINQLSFILGETGILLLKYKFNRSKDIADKIYFNIENNSNNELNEFFWGSSGTMLTALYMYQWTNEDRFKDLFNINVKTLISKLMIVDNIKLWQQDIFDKKWNLLGAAHGFFSNIFPILKGISLVDSREKIDILNMTKNLIIQSSVTDDHYANWPKEVGKTELMQLQWCHGAPGVITSMKYFPVGFSKEVESLLLKAGELIYQAGPLKKNECLCHGTVGNALSFMQLHKRTNDTIWLERAKEFAMFAVHNRSKRFSLFTGDIGIAMVLKSLIKGDDNFPILDEF